MLDNLGPSTLELARHTLKVSWHLGTEKNKDGDKLYYFRCHVWDLGGGPFIPVVDGQYITQLPEDTDERVLIEASLRILDILEASDDRFNCNESYRWRDSLELFSWISPELLEPEWMDK
jgi:hypothetical protein